MTKEETDQKNMANLRTYLNGLGMPKEDRDALPYGTTRTDLLSYAKGYEDAKREAREVTEVGGWISVDDGLPQRGEIVIVYSAVHGVEVTNYDQNGFFFGDDGPLFRVDYWQPLPKPPKTT